KLMGQAERFWYVCFMLSPPSLSWEGKGRPGISAAKLPVGLFQISLLVSESIVSNTFFPCKLPVMACHQEHALPCILSGAKNPQAALPTRRGPEILRSAQNDTAECLFYGIAMRNRRCPVMLSMVGMALG
ncbi:MAG TPA: hypothetical protein VJ761_16350, partial [Ktedonobacteraceae bacterium]|nr:hypothetical protein [Ktedonobacteraceae bacterium]